jgi:hypothetical protein
MLSVVVITKSQTIDFLNYSLFHLELMSEDFHKFLQEKHSILRLVNPILIISHHFVQHHICHSILLSLVSKTDFRGVIWYYQVIYQTRTESWYKFEIVEFHEWGVVECICALDFGKHLHKTVGNYDVVFLQQFVGIPDFGCKPMLHILLVVLSLSILQIECICLEQKSVLYLWSTFTHKFFCSVSWWLSHYDWEICNSLKVTSSDIKITAIVAPCPYELE